MMSLVRRNSRLFLALLTALAGTAFAADDYFPPSDTKGGWRTLKDPADIRQKTGIDVQKLDEAFDYVQQTSQHGGLLVVRNGYLIYEKYFGPRQSRGAAGTGIVRQSLHQSRRRDHAEGEGR
jgi:hypothetical protein